MSRVLSIGSKLERAGVAVSLLSAAVASAGGFARAAQGQEAADAAVAPQGAVEEIVVTARNRTERAQSVPMPISVIGGAQIDRERAFTIADLTQRAPALTATTPNARRTGVSIRGIGKASGNDNMEAAVGVIVDDVFLGHVGMSYQDFTDLERVEMLRGPQGTLLGKNTTLGVIKYASRAPSFTPEGSFDVELGLDPGANKTRGSYSNALIDDVLAYRVSFFNDEQDGDLLNVNTGWGVGTSATATAAVRSCCTRRATTYRCASTSTAPRATRTATPSRSWSIR